jgi:hypothetical protein
MAYGTPVNTSSTGRNHDTGAFNSGRIYDRTRRNNTNDKSQNPTQGGEALELLYRSSAIDTIVFNDDYDTSSGGWTPSTFRSSRTNKAVRGIHKSTTTINDKSQQGLGLKDLMDTEDLVEFERRRVLVPVRGRYLTQMLAGTGTFSGDQNDNNVAQFTHALIGLGSRGLGYGIMVTATSVTPTNHPALEDTDAGVSAVNVSRKRPLARPANKKRLKLSISSYGEDDEDEDTVTLRPKKLRILGNFTTSSAGTIQKTAPTANERAAAGTIKFVGKSQRTAAAAALAVKTSTIKASNETVVFIRAGSDLVVYTTTNFTESGIATHDGADSKEKKPNDTKPVNPELPLVNSSNMPLIDTSRPEHKFLAQLSEELSNRFHPASSSPMGSDGWADPNLDAPDQQQPVRQVQPYVFNPLLLKRFGINPSLPNQPQQGHKLQNYEQQDQPDEVVVNNSSTHVNLHRNESFLRKPANRDLFNRIFG